jgi:ribbon-helix-helix protein
MKMPAPAEPSMATPMRSSIMKRSVVIAGHKTSVSLEDDFWSMLKEIADQRGTSLKELIATIKAHLRQGRSRASHESVSLPLMPRVLPRGYRPKPDHRRVLALLATSRDGLSETALLKHGCTAEQISDLVQQGLATMSMQRIPMGNRIIEVARVRITEDGRRAAGTR